jgi:hypothetical protein
LTYHAVVSVMLCDVWSIASGRVEIEARFELVMTQVSIGRSACQASHAPRFAESRNRGPMDFRELVFACFCWQQMGRDVPMVGVPQPAIAVKKFSQQINALESPCGPLRVPCGRQSPKHGHRVQGMVDGLDLAPRQRRLSEEVANILRELWDLQNRINQLDAVMGPAPSKG